MPIIETKAYQVGTLVFPTLQEAQKKELTDLLTPGLLLTPGITTVDEVVDSIIRNTDEVVAVLTCQPKSKAPRKPRSDKGAKRNPKTDLIPKPEA